MRTNALLPKHDKLLLQHNKGGHELCDEAVFDGSTHMEAAITGRPQEEAARGHEGCAFHAQQTLRQVPLATCALQEGVLQQLRGTPSCIRIFVQAARHEVVHGLLNPETSRVPLHRHAPSVSCVMLAMSVKIVRVSLQLNEIMSSKLQTATSSSAHVGEFVPRAGVLIQIGGCIMNGGHDQGCEGRICMRRSPARKLQQHDAE